MPKEILTKEELEILCKKENTKRYRFIKRFFDILVSFLALVILIVPLFIINLILLISSGHSSIYKDKRVGKHGKIINVYKFKTMFEDADTHPEKYLNEEQLRQWNTERKVDNDPRETKIGRVLRKTSIDELPQFVNVLIGNMSLVGCRPITTYEFDEYFSELEKQVIYKTKPGITGNWQVYSRTESTWESGQRKKLMLEYVKNRSIKLDIKLFFLTIPACIKYFIHKTKKSHDKE